MTNTTTPSAASREPTPPAIRPLTTVLALAVVSIILLVGVDAVAFLHARPAKDLLFLALGDSISRGAENDANLTSGYYADVLSDWHGSPNSTMIQKIAITKGKDLACPSETTFTMLHGNCHYKLLVTDHCDNLAHDQVDDALACLSQNTLQFITLSIGANDFIDDIDTRTIDRRHPDQNPCTARPQAFQDLNEVATDLPNILNKLVPASGGPASHKLFLLTYYNPLAHVCRMAAAAVPITTMSPVPVTCVPASSAQPPPLTFIQCINSIIRSVASRPQYQADIVDIYSLFAGGSGMESNVCTWTWNCADPPMQDIHPNPDGYRAIARTVEAVVLSARNAMSGSNTMHIVAGDGLITVAYWNTDIIMPTPRRWRAG